MQNLLSFAKLLQGFPHGNDFPEKLAKDWKRAGPITVCTGFITSKGTRRNGIFFEQRRLSKRDR
jgi:hypothetical protein